jgi:hypothetical protein
MGATPDDGIRTVVETGKELMTHVVDVAQPRLRVFFQGTGTYAGHRFTDSWHADVVPEQDGSQTGSAQGILSLNEGGFLTWRATADSARFRSPGRFIAEGEFAFTGNAGQALAELANRTGRFRDEFDDSGSYRRTITLS